MNKLKIIRGLIVGIIGTVFLVTGIYNLIGVTTTGNDINVMTESDFKDGKFVKGSTNISFGDFCEETTTSKGRTTGYNRYYLIGIENCEKLLVIKAKEKHFDLLDSITAETYDALAETAETAALPIHSIEVNGKLRTYNSEVKGYIGEYFEDNPDEVAMPYYVDIDEKENAYVSLCIGVFLSIVGGIVLLIGFFRK